MATTRLKPGTAEYHAQKVIDSKLWMRDLATQDFVIIDFETTGLEGEPMQVAVIDNQERTLISTLVKPLKFEIDPGAVAIHKITAEMVEDAPTFPEIYEQLRGALEGKVVVAYNAKFDKEVLARTCEAYGLEMPKSIPDTWADPMFIYAAYRGDWNDYFKSYKWPKLTDALKDFAIELDGEAHDALVDVRITYHLIHAIAKEDRDHPDHPDYVPF